MQPIKSLKPTTKENSMAIRSSCSLLLLTAASMFFSTLPAADADDEVALLAFKAATATRSLPGTGALMVDTADGRG